MKCPPLITTTLLAFSLLGLTACGGDDGEPSSNTDEGTTGGEDTGGGTTGNGDGTTGDGGSTPTGGGNADLTDAIPRYLTAACGAVPVSDAPYSNSASAPTTMMAGQIVAGRIDPDSAGNTEHYWSIDLQPGYYHLVLEGERVDSRRSNLGIELTDLNGAGDDDDVRLLRGNDTGYRARFYEFLEVPEARTLTIRATTVHAAEDYTFALFGNGSDVPSPYYDDCPTIATLSLETTEALTLPVADSADDERWYRVDLEARDYLLSSSAARTDGTSSNIIYEFGYTDQFGQDERYERISRVNETGVSTTGSGALRRSEAGPVLIRLINSNDELDMEFTVQPDD